MKSAKLVRRKCLSTSAMGLMGVRSLGAAPAFEWTDQEKANVQIVNDFCAAWLAGDITRPLQFLADDSIYRMSETAPPAQGHAGVIERLKSYVDASERVEFKVIETFAKGPIVMNHRIDSFASNPARCVAARLREFGDMRARLYPREDVDDFVDVKASDFHTFSRNFNKH